MPRLARLKTSQSIYHIMCRSISECNLLNDEDDKIAYIDFIKHYQKEYNFKIYSYCFMDNHLHMIVDSNGADISKIMHGIDFSYAGYYNRKYARRGPLFQDRFKSKIIDTDRYLVTVSAYIHNNPTAIKGYKSCPEKYKYSSLSVYLGLNSDPFHLIDTTFVLSLFGDKFAIARKRYYQFVFKCDSKLNKDIEFEDEGTLYASQRTILSRNVEAEKIIEFASAETNIPKFMFQTKYNRKITAAKALLVVLLKNLGNLNSPEICSLLGNVTQANVSWLVNKGLKLIHSDDKYQKIFQDSLRLCNLQNMS